jgi:hypothetical protein
MLRSRRGGSPICRFTANRDPDSRSRPNREAGVLCLPVHGDSLPVSRPNREWGERELGNSGSGDASCAVKGWARILKNSFPKEAARPGQAG